LGSSTPRRAFAPLAAREQIPFRYDGIGARYGIRQNIDTRRSAHIGSLYLHIDVVFGFSSLPAYVAARRIVLRFREVIETG
jgi:hypothetical protein